MAMFEHGDARLYYEISGPDDGYPVFTLAPGGMRSRIDWWSNAPWRPLERLDDTYRLIAMDQRNAGRSSAPIRAEDSWATYTADQIALLDHLGIGECHVLGMCIGGPLIAGLLTAHQGRFRSAVMLQPVGIDDNLDTFAEMFEEWVDEVAEDHPEADAATWRSFESNLWDREFVLTATPEDLESITTPLLVMMGNDVYHPPSTSREIARRAPDATLVERWRDDDVLDDTDATIRAFLADHTP